MILLDSLDGPEASANIGSDSSFLQTNMTTALRPTDSEESKTRAAMRQATISWLKTALCGGQVGRIVSPLFSTLLHPSTARTSLLSIRRRRRLLRLTQYKKDRRERRLRKQLTKALSNTGWLIHQY